MDYITGTKGFSSYCGNEYFLQGYYEAETFNLELYIIENPDNNFEWQLLRRAGMSL